MTMHKMEKLLSLVVIFIALGLGKGQKMYNVVDYSAQGDGETDDSKAFIEAWKAACEDSNSPILEIPADKTFLLQPVVFQGPCKSSKVHFQIKGNIVAPSGADKWSSEASNEWIKFESVSGLTVVGSGKIDGQGDSWWTQFKEDHKRPTAIRFNKCDKLTINGTNSVNSPRNHFSISDCHGVSITEIHLVAPEDSPNTDGIDFSSSTNVDVFDTVIATGDDCVAINGGCSYINITNMRCGPGHGISVGSLGKDGLEETVEHVTVRNCSFDGTQNGARIKTWEGGLGFARNILFEHITLKESRHPIIIDQHYCNGRHDCPSEEKAVKVSNVTYRHFTGTSADEEAISLNCSEKIGCNDIVFEDIKLTYSKDPNRELSASCSYASVLTKQVSVNISCPDSLTPAPSPYGHGSTPSHPAPTGDE